MFCFRKQRYLQSLGRFFGSSRRRTHNPIENCAVCPVAASGPSRTPARVQDFSPFSGRSLGRYIGFFPVAGNIPIQAKTVLSIFVPPRCFFLI